MARVPPSRHDVDRGLWIPNLREGSFSPLRTCCQSFLPRICPSQRLPTQRIRRCGLSDMSPIQSQPCAGVWRPHSPNVYRDVPVAADRKSSVAPRDAVMQARVRAGRGRERSERVRGPLSRRWLAPLTRHLRRRPLSPSRIYPTWASFMCRTRASITASRGATLDFRSAATGTSR